MNTKALDTTSSLQKNFGIYELFRTLMPENKKKKTSNYLQMYNLPSIKASTTPLMDERTM